MNDGKLGPDGALNATQRLVKQVNESRASQGRAREPIDTLDHEMAAVARDVRDDSDGDRLARQMADQYLKMFDRLRALADEVEALRKETDRLKGREEIMSESLAKASAPPLAYEGDDTDLLFRFGFFLAEHHAALATVIRYREALDGALLMHTSACALTPGHDGTPCDCWVGKVEALIEAAPQTETPT